MGVRILDARTLEALRRSGVRVDPVRETAHMDGDWLDARLGGAPSRFLLCSRDGQTDLPLGEGRVHFGNGGRVFRILDMQTGGDRPTTLRDVARTAALVQALEHLDFYIVACQAGDLSGPAYHLNDFFQSFCHTAKHVMGGCDTAAGFGQVWDLAARLAGGEAPLEERPFFSVITNPISPLTVDPGTLRILEACTARGIPVTCAPAPIAGATAPASLAGTLAQMHAEALAGAALAQFLRPGAKILYGAVATAMDLRRMDLAFGSVETAMMNAAAVQLAGLYGLPVYATAGLTEAKRPDIQAGFEKTSSLLLVALAGADFIHLAAGTLDSGNSIALEQYVIDNEIIGMVKRILAGIRVDEGTLGLDAVERVGPGGNYVTEDHTADFMMSEFFYPELCVRSLFDVWERDGRPSMLSRAREVVTRILGEEGGPVLEAGDARALRRAFPGIVDP